jgi:rhodanese-related sulfurtransferase|tara:strand:- start:5887 stop:6240 length:354 start_codon:yes stop_codon:yes gene_type:complete
MVKINPGEPYSRISSEEAYEMQSSGDSLIIDVRNEDEYIAGHIKDAKWIPVDEIVQRVDELPESGNLLFICAVGARSGLAAEYASSLGIESKRLFNIEDGTPTWLDKGLPSSTGKNK